MKINQPKERHRMKTTKSKTTKLVTLTPAQKRVAIAKDVLAQIKARRAIIKFGTFGKVIGLPNHNQEISQEILTKYPRLVCAACAVGCAVISAIRLFNEKKVNNQFSDFDTQVLKHWFPFSQCRLIEIAFEQGNGFHSVSDRRMEHRAMEFGNRYKDNTKRAVAIFKNIIRNKGTFKL